MPTFASQSKPDVLEQRLEFGYRIEKLRTSHNIRLVDAARCCGVTAQLLYRWETGMSRPTDWSKLRTLAQLYHVSLEYLMYGEMHDARDRLHRRYE